MQTIRHTCRTAALPSRASPAPTKGGVVWLPGTCGSWLASDADNSTHLPDRGAAIAGKPGSHKGWSGVVPRYLWELACQRCRQLDMPAGPRHCHRGQARLPQRGEWCGSSVPVGAGLPAMQTTRHTCRTGALPSRASPAPTKGGVVWLPGICGSWLASDADNLAYLPDRGAAIAGKPDSHIRMICGSWLASDADNSAYLPDRGAAIAGKPGSHIRVICGSWLASDADNSAYLPDCGAAIAGSPTLTKGGVVWFPGTCGSWLASDADNSTCLPDCGAAIAGKPGSHKGWNGVAPRYLWELARQRCRQLGIPVGPR